MIALLLLLTILSVAHAFQCSVPSCAYLGARAACCPSTPCLPIACAVWHATQLPALCDYACPSTCLPPSLRPIATDAVAYCNRCTLARASCKSGFDILGPIDHGVSYALDVEVLPTATPLPPSPRPVQDISAMFTPVVTPQPNPDTTAVAEVTATAEESPEETPEMEITFSSKKAQFPTCSVEFCSRYGANAECELQGSPSTCGDWSAAGEKSECFTFCTFQCITGPAAPLGSDGHRYCSLCHLRLVSCRSGFVIYGPINQTVGPKPNSSLETS